MTDAKIIQWPDTDTRWLGNQGGRQLCTVCRRAIDMHGGCLFCDPGPSESPADGGWHDALDVYFDAELAARRIRDETYSTARGLCRDIEAMADATYQSAKAAAWDTYHALGGQADSEG